VELASLNLATEFDHLSSNPLPGAISQCLASECKSILGIDIKQEAVDVYNRRVADQGISSDEMKAVCLDLMRQTNSITEKFDAIVVRWHWQSSVYCLRVMCPVFSGLPSHS
jgi:hypothetical protein